MPGFAKFSLLFNSPKLSCAPASHLPKDSNDSFSILSYLFCDCLFVWLWRDIFNMSVSKSTSEPFGVVLDCAEGRAVAEAAIDHCVDGQEVCHGARKETSI